jgi:hypothetical protein
VNKQVKVIQVKKLVESAALTQRIVREAATPEKNPQNYSHTPLPNIVQSLTEGAMSDIRATIITIGDAKTVFKQETYFWGSKYYYKDGLEIDEKSYTTQLAKYLKK